MQELQSRLPQNLLDSVDPGNSRRRQFHDLSPPAPRPDSFCPVPGAEDSRLSKRVCGLSATFSGSKRDQRSRRVVSLFVIVIAVDVPLSTVTFS